MAREASTEIAVRDRAVAVAKAAAEKALAEKEAEAQAACEAISAAATRPGVVIQSSAVGYYGPRGAEDIPENVPPADDFLASVCQQSTLRMVPRCGA